MHINDLVGKRIVKIVTRKENGKQGREYIATIKLEDDSTIVFMPHLTESSKYLAFYKIIARDEQPKSWRQKLIDKAMLKLKLKVEKYEEKHKPQPMELEEVDEYSDTIEIPDAKEDAQTS